MKIKLILIFCIFSINYAHTVVNENIKNELEKNQIIGVITKDNRILFYNEQDCQKYGRFQWCALQNSGDFEGWYEGQGQAGSKLGSQVGNLTDSLSENAKEVGKKFLNWISQKAQDMSANQETK
jgi:hypothetical protein